jgi:hypothetical protein
VTPSFFFDSGSRLGIGISSRTPSGLRAAARLPLETCCSAVLAPPSPPSSASPSGTFWAPFPHPSEFKGREGSPEIRGKYRAPGRPSDLAIPLASTSNVPPRMLAQRPLPVKAPRAGQWKPAFQPPLVEYNDRGFLFHFTVENPIGFRVPALDAGLDWESCSENRGDSGIHRSRDALQTRFPDGEPNAPLFRNQHGCATGPPLARPGLTHAV